VIKEFNDAQKSPDTAVAVAAIKALTAVIRSSSATTLMGLSAELKDAAGALQRWVGGLVSVTRVGQQPLQKSQAWSAVKKNLYEPSSCGTDYKDICPYASHEAGAYWNKGPVPWEPGQSSLFVVVQLPCYLLQKQRYTNTVAPPSCMHAMH
jgi:hypothetical protein